MLYDLEWLTKGRSFPPAAEKSRIERYQQNRKLFDNEHFAIGYGATTGTVYDNCCKRISRVIGNFEDVISIPVLLNYQRFVSMKMADLVCGEYPYITGSNDEENAKLKWVLDNTNFFAKLYASVIDISRFGDAPIRLYKEEDGKYSFCLWDAAGWYPIVRQDGTNRIKQHCLCWLQNLHPDVNENDDWYLHVQIHDVDNPGQYIQRKYHNGASKTTIGPQIGEDEVVRTGLPVCAVMHLRAFEVSGTVYGYDDYVPIDSILAEIITRVSQISAILDKHADPAMTGPQSMLRRDEVTGEMYLERGKFYAITPEDTPPSYLVWDGKLDASFKQLEFLVNHLYILSEMGAAITGGTESTTYASSGTAMRLKMTNPLSKARRITNALGMPIRQLLATMASQIPDIDKETGEPGKGKATNLPVSHISVQWEDGLPNNPREQIENCKLATGEDKMIPLEAGLMAYLGKSSVEATQLAQQVREQALKEQEDLMSIQQPKEEPSETNRPGIQDGKGVNPQKKGAVTGLNDFQAENNKPAEK